ncbi:MAG: 3-dehydroquinate synthase, partial [SAR324 cluster bacterium]|nr:3-dehydroquinate synthase [SAR324 cluster bacterium]
MQSLQVNLPGSGYPIHIGAGILAEQLRTMVGNLARELVVVVTNPTVDRLYPAVIAQALSGLPVRVETCLIPDGERFKTLET